MTLSNNKKQPDEWIEQKNNPCFTSLQLNFSRAKIYLVFHPSKFLHEPF